MRLVIFYPAVGIGGAQILFARIAESLASEGFKIVIVDFGNGYINNYLKNRIEFSHVLLGPKDKYESDADDVILLALSMIFSYKNSIEPNAKTRLAFWDLHPYNLIENTAFSFFYKRSPFGWLSTLLKYIEFKRINKIRLIIDYLADKNALYFMCQKNYLFNKEFFGCAANPNFLPIPIPLIPDNLVNSSENIVFQKTSVSDIDVKKKENFLGLLNIGWISRLDLDKIPVLNLLIEDIDRFAASTSKYKIIIHIIGEGSAINDIRCPKHVERRMIGRLEQNILSSYVAKNIDIGFAMGTSVLEFAARKKPAVMVPSPTLYDYFKKRRCRYVWLHQAETFDVAVEDYYSPTVLHQFADILKMYESNSELLAQTSKDYVLRAHSLKSVTNSLKLNISRLNFYYSDYINTGFAKKTYAEKITLWLKKFFKAMLVLYRKRST